MGSAGDQIAFAGGAQATVNAGGSLVTVTAPTGYDGSPHVLISSPTTDLTATSAGTAAFVLNAAAGNWSGYNLALATTPSAITVSGTANSSQPTLYFKGGLDGNWNTFAGGAANNSNWTTGRSGDYRRARRTRRHDRCPLLRHQPPRRPILAPHSIRATRSTVSRSTAEQTQPRSASLRAAARSPSTPPAARALPSTPTQEHCPSALQPLWAAASRGPTIPPMP